MSSPNQPQSAPASGPAVDTRSGRCSEDQSAGGGGIAGALKKITSKLAWVMAGIIFAGILCHIPPTIVYLFESKKRDAIDNNIPPLIRDIADAGRSGMTLTRAIEIPAERDYE